MPAAEGLLSLLRRAQPRHTPQPASRRITCFH